MKNIYLLALYAIMALALPAKSAFNVYDFDDTVKEKQFNTLIDELRCPKCQNNSLSESNAPLATDIKNYVYHAINTGKTNEQITTFLISRYGEFITYRPRSKALWALPTLIGVIAAIMALWFIRRKQYTYAHDDSTEHLLSMKEILHENSDSSSKAKDSYRSQKHS